VNETKRVVFLDYLRVIACFMVMVIHSCEPFYLGGEEGTYVASRWDAFWVTLVECLCRVCVPLFVMASSYLMFPIASGRSVGDFFRRRLTRVVVPFLVWSAVYVAVFACGSGVSWGKAAFNFPMEGGHLWFVPMLVGLYVLMPLLSPWAERASEKEIRGWILVWFFTTLFPFLRRLWGFWFGAPDFGAVPYLWGECPWNGFGAFHYVSGFFGYMLLGFWFRKFVPELSWGKTLAFATPLWLAGVAIVGLLFFFRIPDAFPYSAPYAKAVDLEMSIEYCSLGVALTVVAAFLVMRKFAWDGAFYRCFVRPVSEASYGMYLVHLIILLKVFSWVSPHCCTPCAIVVTAVVSYLASAVFAIAVRKIPVVGKWIGG